MGVLASCELYPACILLVIQSDVFLTQAPILQQLNMTISHIYHGLALYPQRLAVYQLV